MTESHDPLIRIEGKVDKLSEVVTQIQVNQARDLQRFSQIEQQFAEASRANTAEFNLHKATCTAIAAIGELAGRLDAIENKAAGARWAGGRLWAAILGVLVILDILSRVAVFFH